MSTLDGTIERNVCQLDGVSTAFKGPDLEARIRPDGAPLITIYDHPIAVRIELDTRRRCANPQGGKLDTCASFAPAVEASSRGGAQHEMMLEDPPELELARKGGTHRRKVDEGEGVLPA